MTATLEQGWHIAPELRVSLRLKAAHKHMNRNDFEQAIIEAEELLDEVPGHRQALALVSRASLAAGDAEGAYLSGEQWLGTVKQPPPPFLSHMALACLHYCQFGKAIAFARRALAGNPSLAEAHWVHGFALMYTGRSKSEALRSMLTAQALDPTTYLPPLSLSKDQWEQAILEAKQQVHATISAFWENVPIVFEDVPTLERLHRQQPPISPVTPGLAIGSPPPQQNPWQSRPERLELYTYTLSRTPTIEELPGRIALVFEREATTWLDLDSAVLDDERLGNPSD